MSTDASHSIPAELPSRSSGTDCARTTGDAGRRALDAAAELVRSARAARGFRLAGLLLEIRTDEHFELAGFDSFDAYLTVELRLDPSRASKLVTAAALARDLGIPAADLDGVDPEKVYLARAMFTGSTWRQALQLCRNTPKRELSSAVRREIGLESIHRAPTRARPTTKPEDVLSAVKCLSSADAEEFAALYASEVIDTPVGELVIEGMLRSLHEDRKPSMLHRLHRIAWLAAGFDTDVGNASTEAQHA